MSVLAYEWTFLKVFWAMLAFFAFVIFVWLIVMVLYDNFARHDHSGVAKAGLDDPGDLPPVHRRPDLPDGPPWDGRSPLFRRRG